jgi:hypothetical protein
MHHPLGSIVFLSHQALLTVRSRLAGRSICDFCSPGEYSSLMKTQNFILTSTGNYNLGVCAGTYVYDPLDRILNGRPIFINPSANRFVGWDTSAFRCSNLNWLGGIVAAQGFFGGYASQAWYVDITCCWNYFTAVLTPPGDLA